MWYFMQVMENLQSFVWKKKTSFLLFKKETTNNYLIVKHGHNRLYNRNSAQCYTQ